MSNPIKLKAHVLSVKSFGPDTYSVKFKPEVAPPRFKAGQFLHLTIDEYDPAGGFWPESRVFSIASAPGMSELEIVYSVKGRYTRRMAEYLSPGREVWLKLPYGNFIIDASIAPGQDVVIIAGGTGISPFLPYFHALAANKQKARTVRLYYGIRQNAMLLAGDLIEECVRAALLEVSLFVENEKPALRLPSFIRQESGRLDINQIHAESSDLNNPAFFISGPPAMITAFKDGLARAGISPENIKIDEWE